MARAKRPEGASGAAPPLPDPLPDPRTDPDAWRAAVIERDGFDPLTEIGFTLTDAQRREIARREETAASQAVADRAAKLQAREAARRRGSRQVPPAVTTDELRVAVARLILFAQHYDRPKMDPDGTEHPDVPSGPAEIAARGDAEMTRRLRAVVRSIDTLSDHVRHHVLRARLSYLIDFLAKEYGAIASERRVARQAARHERARLRGLFGPSAEAVLGRRATDQELARHHDSLARACQEVAAKIVLGRKATDEELVRLRELRSPTTSLKWGLADLLTLFLGKAPTAGQIRALLARPRDFARARLLGEKEHRGPKDLAVKKVSRVVGMTERRLYEIHQAHRAHPTDYFHNEWVPEMAESLLGRKRILEYVLVRLLSLTDDDLRAVLEAIEQRQPSRRRVAHVNPTPANTSLRRRRKRRR